MLHHVLRALLPIGADSTTVPPRATAGRPGDRMASMISRAPAPAADRRAPFRSRAGARALMGVLCLLLALAVPGVAQAQSQRWQWPVPSPHQVVHAFDAPDHPFGPGHRGIDIAVPAGGQVRAVEGGTVRFAGVVAGRGVVSVLHPDGLISTYEPVTAEVSEGEAVEAGDVLGVLEEAGAAISHCREQDCLHLGARQGQDYLDPLLLLGARGPSVLLTWPDPSVGGIDGGPDRTSSGPAPGAGSGPAAGVAPRYGAPPVALLD